MSSNRPKEKLEYYEKLLSETILKYQDPITGLIPTIPNTSDAWIRDNCFAVLSIWSLALSYKKVADKDEEKAKTYELEQNCVKLMRSLLVCFIKQSAKLERFKYTQSTKDSFHAKYNVRTLNTVVEDFQWGHLQIDAISLYLLTLAQMTASGLQIIFTLDEVSFIQNMVFYIEEAYRIADYGIWERGEKTNQGLPELNSSSIGMAKAAMDSLNELDLFGASGGQESMIHCVAGESQQCEIVLESMLPRESNSKETDSSILFITGFPGFAVDKAELIQFTKKTIIQKLQGRYGFKRFLRDGYMTALEDPTRLYYEPYELKTFENIECEWPMFFALMKIDAVFAKNYEELKAYDKALEAVMIKRADGIKLMPELYAVPIDKVQAEYKDHHSQDRVPKGKLPSLIGQSLYIISCLLMDNYIAVGEIDPLNRRLNTEPRPELVVQVAVITSEDSIKDEIMNLKVPFQTTSEISSLEIHPSRVLTKIYSYLGTCKKLQLSGRPLNETFLLSTCKLYTLGDRMLAFTSHYLDRSEFYMASDHDLLVDMFKMLLGLLANSWKEVGRPTMILHFKKTMLDEDGHLPKCIITTLGKLKDGYLGGVRVQLGLLNQFLSTSCITNISWLSDVSQTTLSGGESVLNKILGHQRATKPQLSPAIHRNSKVRWANMRRYTQICQGLVKRTKSILVDEANPDLIRVRSHFQGGVTTEPKTAITKQLSPMPELELPQSPHQSMLNTTKGGDSTPYDHFTEWNKDIESSSYHKIDTTDLIKMLVQTDSLNEQADIIHYLYITKGPGWVVNTEEDTSITVLDLLQELYDKACHAKQWWLVRHAAGLLKKRVDNLSKIVTDLLVHQKQVTVGLPPEPREKIIKHPLPPDQLRDMINNVYGGDSSSAMLTQELLVYLSILIGTEPNLFSEMLRLRTGLILQVMASELARVLDCSGEEASDHLLNLSPYEMKVLLSNILSGKEFNIGSSWVPEEKASPGSIAKEPPNIDEFKLLMKRKISSHIGVLNEAKDPTKVEIPLQGQWLRRRRLDGSLNRVPVNFYYNVWMILEKCQYFRVAGNTIDSTLIKEMTPGEMKFSLHIESVLNLLPHPEYRQLVVEGILAMIAITDASLHCTISQTINMDDVVHQANQIFIQDQRKIGGDATLCCAGECPLACGGVEGICQNFYDSAPSGKYGTFCYLCRSLATIINFAPIDDKTQCHIN